MRFLLWASCAALGLLALLELFVPKLFAPNLPADATMTAAIAAVAALTFVLVDYCESRTNFSLALAPTNPRWRALLDSVYWTRTIGVLLFAVGAGSAIMARWALGWNAEGASLEKPWPWLPGPLLAGLAVLVSNAIDGAPAKRHKAALFGWAAAVAIAIVAVPAIVLVAWMVQHIVTPTVGASKIPEVSPAPNTRAAGLLLLLQFGLVYFVIAFRWVGEPMSTANLGSILPLQLARTPAQVKTVLENWRQLLVNCWSSDDEFAGPAARALRDVVRRALWRDIFGLIPLYALVLAFGSWYATQLVGLPPLLASVAPIGHPLGWREALTITIVSLPLIAAVADYIEDTCHLRYLRLHETRESPSASLTLVSFAASLTKIAAFVAASVVAGLAFLLGSFKLALLGESTGWRGSLALLIALVIGGSIAVTVIAIVCQRLAAFFGRKRTPDSMRDVVPSVAFVQSRR